MGDFNHNEFNRDASEGYTPKKNKGTKLTILKDAIKECKLQQHSEILNSEGNMLYMVFCSKDLNVTKCQSKLIVKSYQHPALRFDLEMVPRKNEVIEISDGDDETDVLQTYRCHPLPHQPVNSLYYSSKLLQMKFIMAATLLQQIGERINLWDGK